MTGNSEQIILEADGSQVERVVKKANRDIESYGETVIRVSDRSKNAIDRLVSSMTKQADVYGKTGAERLIAQRDQLVQRYANEQRAVDSITASYNKMIAVENEIINKKRQEEEASKRASDARKQAADQARREAEEVARTQSSYSTRYALNAGKDLLEGRNMNSIAESSNFLMGLKGAPLLIGATTAALAGLTLAAKASFSSLGDYGMEMQHLKERTGLGTNEVQQFAFAAKRAGVETDIYTRMMRGLSEAADDNSKQGEKARQTLTRLGVSLRDEATGNLRSTSAVLLDISSALNKLPEGFQRDAAAMDIFKRVGIETIPVAIQLASSVKQANDLGLGLNDAELKRWQSYHDLMVETDARWEKFKRSVMEPLATVWNITLKVGGNIVGGHSSGGGLDFSNIWDNVSSSIMHPNSVLHPKDIFSHSSGGGSGSGIKSSDMLPPHMIIDPSSSFPNFRYIMDPVYAKQVAERKAADSYIDGMKVGNTPQDRLRDAESELSKLTKPVHGVTSREDAQAYKVAQDKVNNLKEQIKYTQELTETQRRQKAFLDSINEKDLDPIAQRKQRLQDYLAPQEGRAPLSAGQRFTANTAAYADMAREQDKIKAARQTEMDRLGPEIDEEIQKAILKDIEKTDKVMETIIKDSYREFNENWKKKLEAIKESDRAALDLYDMQATHTAKISSIVNKKDGFGGQINAVQQEYALRQQIRSVELATIQAHSAYYDVAKEQARIELASTKDRYDAEEKILELKQKEFDEVKKTTDKLAETLITHPHDFAKQLRDTVQQAATTSMAGVIGGVAAKVITPIIYGANGQGGISGVIHGMGGQQPGTPGAKLQITMDQSAQATSRNTDAIYQLISVLSGSSAAGTSKSAGSVAPVGVPGGPSAGPDGASFAQLAVLAGAGGLSAYTNYSLGSSIRNINRDNLAVSHMSSALPGMMAPSPYSPVQASNHMSLPQLMSSMIIPGSAVMFGRYGGGRGSLNLGGSPTVPGANAQYTMPGGLINRTGQSIGGVPSIGSNDLPLFSGVDQSFRNPILGSTDDLPLFSRSPSLNPDLGALDAQFGMADNGTMGGVALAGSGGGGSNTGGAFVGSTLGKVAKVLGLDKMLGGAGGSGGSGGASGGSMPSPTSFLSNLKGMVGFGGGPGSYGNPQGKTGPFGNQLPAAGTGFTGGVSAVAGSPLAGAAGMYFAQRGLLGQDRGTWGGVAEGTLGGAEVGFQYGGPIGAAIGAAAGFGIGLGEELVGALSPANMAKKLIKQRYGISIDTAFANQIVSLANQKYGGKVSLAVLDPSIRQALGVYATGTGQKMSPALSTPMGASLSENNGKLYQDPTYQYGNAYSYKSSLPVYGGVQTAQLSGPTGPIQLNVNGQSAADLLEGRIASTVTPGYVSDSYSAALGASNNRISNSAMIQQPGLITS